MYFLIRAAYVLLWDDDRERGTAYLLLKTYLYELQLHSERDEIVLTWASPYPTFGLQNTQVEDLHP